MPLLDVQMEFASVGEIRIGESTRNTKGKKVARSLDHFLFTSRDRRLADYLAATYGGTVAEWPEERGKWAVHSTTASITVTVPLTNAMIVQDWEMYQGGNCLRRCDSVRNRITGRDCECPSDQDARAQLAKTGAACKPTTRLFVVLVDAPALGTWKVVTHSIVAAKQLAATAHVMQFARAAGDAGRQFQTADLTIATVGSGQKQGRIPALTIKEGLRALVAGQPAADGPADITSQLPPPPNRLALEAAAPAAQPAQPQRPAPPSGEAEPPPDDEYGPHDDPGAELPEEEVAHRIAQAAAAATTAAQVAVHARRADAARVRTVMVTVDDTVQQLIDYLTARWKALNAAEQTAAGTAQDGSR
jgi:hypothetical protein